MTKLKTNLFKILACKKGEMLIESVISLLVFTVLMLSVTMMIVTSLKITEKYTLSAEKQQEGVNIEALERPAANSEERELTISWDGVEYVKMTVELPQNNNNKSFYPKVSP